MDDYGGKEGAVAGRVRLPRRLPAPVPPHTALLADVPAVVERTSPVVQSFWVFGGAILRHSRHQMFRRRWSLLLLLIFFWLVPSSPTYVPSLNACYFRCCRRMFWWLFCGVCSTLVDVDSPPGDPGRKGGDLPRIVEYHMYIVQVGNFGCVQVY